MRSTSLFVVIINWNRKDLTLACLKSLQPVVKRRKDVSVIVVDNNSSDNSVTFLKRLKLEFVLIENKKNLGWAGGNNVGIRYALRRGASAIFILANDAVVTEDALDILEKRLNMDKKIGIVGPKIYFAGKKNVLANAGGFIMKHRYFGYDRGMHQVDNGQYDSPIAVDFITGAAMLIKRELFEKVGLFDEELFIYYEDGDLCFRARKNGYICFFEPKANVYHVGGATTKFGSALHVYYTTRNHLRFIEKHAPFSVKVREFLRTPKTIYELLKSKNRIVKKYTLLGIRDYYLRKFGQQTYW